MYRGNLTKKEQKADVWAKEQTAYEYLNQIIKDGWTATRTPGEFDDWDVDITNNATGKTVIAENKIRDIDANYVRKEGAMINFDKVEKMAKTRKEAFIWQYFYVNNETYKWSLEERDKWPIEEVETKKNSYTNDTVVKLRYFMPMDEAHRVYTVDLSDYNDRYNYNYNLALNRL